MIRVTFTDGTTADLPDETPADPFGEPGADETPMTLEQVRLDSTSAHVLIGGTWRGCLVETLGEEAQRLRAERDAEKARADAAEKKLSRAVELSFCEGALDVRRATDQPDGWEMGGGAFARSRGLTLDEAFTSAEEMERDLGYRLPADEVLARCKTAVKAAGWEACAETSTESATIFRPVPPKITTIWVAFPRIKRTPEEHRLAAAQAAHRLRTFGIDVDLSR